MNSLLGSNVIARAAIQFGNEGFDIRAHLSASGFWLCHYGYPSHWGLDKRGEKTTCYDLAEFLRLLTTQSGPSRRVPFGRGPYPSVWTQCRASDHCARTGVRTGTALSFNPFTQHEAT
jgi:hypothetical protein